MASVERLQDLWNLNLFLIRKGFSIRTRKIATSMIGFVSMKGKLLIGSLVSFILKQREANKLMSYHHSYEFSCQSTPENPQIWRGKTKNRHQYKFLSCLSSKAIDVVVPKSIIILPSYSPLPSRAKGSGPVLAIEGYWTSIASIEEKYGGCDVDRLAEEFIQGFYKQLREQRY